MSGHLPKIHYVPSDSLRTFPIWVDASMVLNRDGIINPLIEKPEGQAFLRSLLASPLENGCVPQDMVIVDLVNPPNRGSIEEATRNSRLVILGKVTERAFGVYVYLPGQLLRVAPEQILKGEPREVPAYFVFMPVGNFKIGSVPICAKDSRVFMAVMPMAYARTAIPASLTRPGQAVLATAAEGVAAVAHAAMVTLATMGSCNLRR